MTNNSAPKTITIIIPVFNEERNIVAAVEAVEKLFAEKLAAYRLEIVINDNASTDGSWEIIKQLAATRSHLRGYRFSRNFGYQNSIFAGMSVSTGDAVVELDADLEDPPDVIPHFVSWWEQGYDVVYGVRSSRHGSEFTKTSASAFYRILNKFSDLKIPENAGDFRLLDRKVVDVLLKLPEHHLYLRGLVSYVGFKQKAVEYDRNPRASGASKFSLLQYSVLALDAITSFTRTPLRLVGGLGVILFLISAILATNYIIGRIFFGTPLPGFTTLVVLMLFLHSITFIFLGIHGEYLSRVFDDTKNRPRAIIAEATEDTDLPRIV